jgi:nitrite reductase/ring-hydroxylating ferredoxin subunit
MTFVKVAFVKDLGPGRMIGVDGGGKEIVVVNLEGKFYAIGNRCTHMSCMLSDGTLKGGNVTCPCHGSIFDVATGSVMKGPAKKSEPAYQTKIEGEQILVDV